MNAGYLLVCINYHNKPLARLAHRLTTEAFLGPCPAGLEVNHIDGIKTNNAIDNLEYVTPIYNRHQSFTRIPRGERHWHSKITEGQANQIRQLHSQGLGYKRLAKTLNLSWSLVRAVASGKTWRHLPLQ